MKNRHEELTDIPIEFVNDIVFEMGTYVQEPTKITLTIPSHLERNGKLEEVYVYNAIKGKMQLKLFTQLCRLFFGSLQRKDDIT